MTHKQKTNISTRRHEDGKTTALMTDDLYESVEMALIAEYLAELRSRNAAEKYAEFGNSAGLSRSQ
jgi:hypothetical protein